MVRRSAGYVYLIGCGETDIVKIGRTRDLKERLGAIQRMSPVRVSLLWHTEGDSVLESRLHKTFRERRVYGEWFDFTGSDPIGLIQAAVKDGWQDDIPPAFAHGLRPIAPRVVEPPIIPAAPPAGDAPDGVPPLRPWITKTGRVLRSAGGGLL